MGEKTTQGIQDSGRDIIGCIRQLTTAEGELGAPLIRPSESIIVNIEESLLEREEQLTEDSIDDPQQFDDAYMDYVTGTETIPVLCPKCGARLRIKIEKIVDDIE